MAEPIITSINLNTDIRKFMDETNINKSSFIRDLITESKLFKAWEKDGG